MGKETGREGELFLSFIFLSFCGDKTQTKSVRPKVLTEEKKSKNLLDFFSVDRFWKNKNK